MVPFEAFSIEEPQSSSAFCKGCDGGTQCDRRSSIVLSCACAAPAHRTSAAPSNVALNVMQTLPDGPRLFARLLPAAYRRPGRETTAAASHGPRKLVPANPEIVPVSTDWLY